MRIRIRVEGKVDVSSIKDLFESLNITTMNVTKSERLKEIKEIVDIVNGIRKEVEEKIGKKIVIKELILKKDGLYILNGDVDQES